MRASRSLISAAKSAFRFQARPVSSLAGQTSTTPTRSNVSPSVFNSKRAQTHVSVKQQRRAQSGLGEHAQPAPTFYTEENPGKTALYDLHLQHGAKMVPFGGYSMPVSYSDLSLGESHAWTREKASLFDVGHMVQYHFEGPGAEAFLESMTPAGLKDLAPGTSTLSALLHPVTGGIVDDCIISRLENGPKHLFYVVLNAGCREKDYKFLNSALEKWDNTINPVVHINHLQADGEPYGLIALQGPMSAEILASVLAPGCKVDVTKWYFGSSKHITLNLPQSGESLPVVAARGGYTGEDGFELSLHPSQTVEVTEMLLESAGRDKLRLAGLGARDSLRLEAGMCLYGHDLDDTTTPVEAGLSWVIPKHRRSLEGSGFNGAETIIPQLTPASKGGAGVERRRVGLTVEGAPAREGALIVDENGNEVGKVTSGCPSPTLKKNIAMGYVKNGLQKAGTELQVVVRGKARKAVVTKMPFIPSKYFKPAASPA
ncbi:glycine cleavage system T protein [Hortaea werneckii]|nr:glycine cleavage system T protein [Hortaea werneckii]